MRDLRTPATLSKGIPGENRLSCPHGVTPCSSMACMWTSVTRPSCSSGPTRSLRGALPKIIHMSDVWSWVGALRCYASRSDEDERRSGKEAAVIETQAANERRVADLRLRAGRSEDAGRLGSICYGAFGAISEAHNFPPDFPSPEMAGGLLASLLSREDVYSVVAEADGRVVGSNFLWENGTIAGVGPITIDPDAQNAAVGRGLMEDVLRRAKERNIAGVRLVQAAYHGRSLSLYTKLGFDTREPPSNLHR